MGFCVFPPGCSSFLPHSTDVPVDRLSGHYKFTLHINEGRNWGGVDENVGRVKRDWCRISENGWFEHCGDYYYIFYSYTKLYFA